jgi:ABC-type Mn2+/Zn2+ transport system ATPase subunit
LSGGQQQRTFLARALAQKADVLLLDEPFVGVDIPTEEKIIEVLRKLSGEGKTLMVVHHDLQAVPEYFNHVILLNQRLIAHGPTEEVFTPETLRRAFGGQLALLQQAGQIG